MTRKIRAISLTAILAIAALAIPLGIAEADTHQTMAKVVTAETEFERIMFKTLVDLNPGIAFGYGIISDDNLNSVLVITTHKGILDSEDQTDVNDDSFHSHYVSLIDTDSSCDGYDVEYISWQEPSVVNIRQHAAIMNNIPYDFSGTNGESGNVVDFMSSGNVTNAVTFTIDLVDDAVCINNVTDIDDQNIRSSDDKPTDTAPFPRV